MPESAVLAVDGGPRAVTADFPRVPRYGQVEVDAVTRLIQASHLSETARGPACAAIEDAFAAVVGTAHALSFNSGTASLHSALHAVGVGPDSGPVIVSPMTWISAITAVFHAGAHPVFVDIEPDSPNLTPDLPEGTTAAAVMATHAWGIPARIDQIAAAGMPVIEDCSHAHGAIYRGRPVGSWGAAGCFSLQESKAVSAGEGGILTTSDRLVYERAMTVGHHPHRLAAELTLAETAPLSVAGAAWKYRMPALNAAIGLEQLRRLPERAAASEKNFTALLDAINAADLPIRVPEVAADSVRGWYGTPLYFAEDAADPQALHRALVAEGIPVRAAYDDWTASPVLAAPALAGRFWAAARDYRPPQPESLPNYQQARRRMIVMKIPDIPAEDYMLAVTAALTKITAAWRRINA